MREYGRLHTSFWSSPTIRSMSDDGRMLAAYLLSGPHTNMIGCFRCPDGYVAEDLGWSIERVREGFAELFDKGFATRDEASKWVFVHKFLKWNEIENPNQGKAALKAFEQVPDELPAKQALARVFAEFCRHVDPEKLKPFAKGSGRVSKPGTGTGTGTGEKPLSGKPDVSAPEVELIAYLNERTGRAYRNVESNLRMVRARLAEGASVADVKAVIDDRVAEWKDDPKMDEYLRPDTLFNATKFAQYIGKVATAKAKGSATWWVAQGYGTREEAIAAGATEVAA